MEKVTRKVALTMISGALKEMKTLGYEPTKVVLFGSFAKGLQQLHSDIDLAIWDARFTGSISQDMIALTPVKLKFPRIEFHTYHSSETTDSDPFISEIMEHGIALQMTSEGTPA